MKAITVELHRMNYRPILPHGKIVRTRGVVNQTAYVVIWLLWVLNIELDRSETLQLCVDAFRSLYFWLELLFAIACAILIFLAYILTP